MIPIPTVNSHPLDRDVQPMMIHDKPRITNQDEKSAGKIPSNPRREKPEIIIAERVVTTKSVDRFHWRVRLAKVNFGSRN